MSIFVIMDGEYSDWYIKGYAETSDEAEKICAAHDWYFIEAEKISEIPDVKMCYKQEVAFDLIKGKWEMRIEPNRYIYKIYKGNGLPKSTIGIYPLNCLIINCEIWQLEKNRAKAEKIAQDMLAEFLAQHNHLYNN